MSPVLRGLAIYLVLMLFFRITGKRSLGEVTTFDFVLLLIIGEATQQALLGDDYSVTNALIVILTLMVAEICLNLFKERSRTMDKVMDDMLVVIVADGNVLRERLEREGVDEEDVLEAARELQGLERMDQVKYAVLERNGHISIIPKARE